MSKWKTVTLSNIGEIITGNTPKTSEEENYKSNDIPFLKPSDFNNESIDLENVEFYISEKARKKARILPVGSIAVTCIGIIGKTKIINEECAFNQQINAIIPNDNYYNRYIAYALLFQKELFQMQANAAVVPIINKTDFSKIRIPMPLIDEQRKIAENLDKVTHTIDLCNAILEKLDLLVKSRFVEMFGEPISNSMGWKCCELGACLESIDNGKSYVCDNDCRTGDDPAILKLSAVTYGIYKPDENKAMIDEDLFDESAEVKDNDLLFTRKNTPELVGMSAYVFSTPPKLMMPDLIFRLNAKASCNKIYLWQLINHDLFRPCIQNIANGSAKSMSNISKERLSKLTIPVPPLARQEQFAAFVEQTDKSKLAVKQVLEKAETLKRALMQEYFG